MTRNRASAKAAGSRFERQIADALAAHVDKRIDRAPRRGARDQGDVGNVYDTRGHAYVLECKNVLRLDLPAWTREAYAEGVNAGALVGVVVHKRHGVSDPMAQWVSMTVADLVAILNGRYPE